MKTPLNRRTFLRASGVALGLPFLEAMLPARASAAAGDVPRRIVAINTNLGILSRHFVPEQSGPDYALPAYLQTLADYRDDFTVISGCSHPNVTGGHSAEATFLTAAPHPGSASFRNSISLDQFAADHIGEQTRVSALPLVVAKRRTNQSLSFTSSGVMIPAENSPAAVFKTLFFAGAEAEIERQIHDLRVGRSILDTVAHRATELQQKLGQADKERLDQYFTSVREVERRLEIAEEWERRPKPKVDVPPLTDAEYLPDKLTTIYDLIHLALATDSTRLISLLIKLDGFSAHIPGVSTESHNLSHHVGREDKLKELMNLELAQFRAFGGLLKRLRDTNDGGRPLLDRTMVLYGSNLGNGNNHDTKNMPILLAGGGFKHGQHLAFDQARNEALPRLFVSMLQRLGIEADKFASGTGTLAGLEMAG
tara:strand:- start:2375 stop:3646 length:1272 start_codon:yes stop_codon:yes gene_type:complete